MPGVISQTRYIVKEIVTDRKFKLVPVTQNYCLRKEAGAAACESRGKFAEEIPYDG